CYAPMETCLSFDTTAYTLTKHNYARKIDSHEALDILNMCYDYNLVQCGENVQKQPNFMCNCCKCHCEAFTSAKKFGLLVPVNTTSYIPYVDTHKCIGCGKCTNICPMEAISVTTTGKDKYAQVDDKLCLGCGVCVKNCPKDAIKLKR
ncbi:4Fe-4S binding protein, partial [Clostridioides difficile]